MKKGHFLAAVAGMLMVCGCGEKKETKSVQPVKVRVEQVRMTDVNGEQGYSGTVEEVSGAALSFSGSGTIKRIKKQRLAYEQAREQMADASQKLVINMNNCWANVETSHKQLAIAQKSIEQNEENLRLNNDYYRAGTTTMSDLLDAQSSYQQSRDKYVDAYIGYQQNLLKYRQATGQ